MKELYGGRIYYGWYLVPVGFVCYGLAIAPAYAGWGFFAPRVIEELHLSRTEVGAVAGVFALSYQAFSPLAGFLIGRFGLRITITIGSFITALGLWLLSQSDSLFECFLSYSVIAGIGVALSTVLPMQTLATYWFKKYRARALAVILAGSTTIGAFVQQLNGYLEAHGGWRTGWKVYAGVSIIVGFIAVAFIRNTPEEIGLRPDGINHSPDQPERIPPLAHSSSSTGEAMEAQDHRWSAREAIFSVQFLLVTLCGIAQVGSWALFTAHGRLHLDSLALGLPVILWVLSTKDLMSSTGRLLAAGADFISPRRILILAMFIEGLGMGGLALSTDKSTAYVCAVLFGLGYGSALICIPLAFAELFGREAFVHIAGTSRMTQGIVTSAIPMLAGAIADSLGSYAIPFLGMTGLSILGAIGIMILRPAGLPLQSPSEAKL
jgi:MFS family permease